MKTLQQYLDEADEKFNPPVVGDNFAIEIEDVLIESYIVDIAEDGYVIAADDRVLELLEHCGCTEEQELQEQERLMEIPKELEEEALEEIAEDSLAGILKAAGLPPRKIREGFAPMEFAPLDEVSLDLAKRGRDKAEYYVDMDYDDMRDRPEGYSEKQRSKFQRYIDRKEPRAKGDRDWDPPNKGVAEDLDANQKRVGQLGPTEKVKNNNIGKLVGANESVELSEMDKSQPSSDRGGESSGNPYAKGGKATPVKAKDAEKDAKKALNKSMDKAHNKAIKEGKIMREGQEDLDFIKNLVKPQLKEDSDKVKFLGFTGSQYPLEKALAEKNFRMGTLRSMKMDARGRPYAIIYDPASYGDFVAYWNDSVGAWTIDFD